MRRRLKGKVKFDERGQAAVEMAVVLPVFIVILLGVIAFGRLVYTHLAVMTATNDCVTAAAQATNLSQAVTQGFTARETSLSTYAVSQRVTVGGQISYSGLDRPVSCQVGYPLEQDYLGEYNGVIFLDPKLFTLEYTFQLPAQPYKSNWSILR
jgi:uncharacterized protein (UPF0333 family)